MISNPTPPYSYPTKTVTINFSSIFYSFSRSCPINGFCSIQFICAGVQFIIGIYWFS